MSAAAEEERPSTALRASFPAPLAAVLADELGELPGSEPWRGAVLSEARVLQQALRDGDERRAIAAAAALGGLGEGSTPAGDDYLIGVVHALLSSGDGDSSRLAASLAAAAAPRTTARSGEWLVAASCGEASPRWASLLAALPAGDVEATRRAAADVRRSGHTSGAFSLRGFLDTIGD